MVKWCLSGIILVVILSLQVQHYLSGDRFIFPPRKNDEKVQLGVMPWKVPASKWTNYYTPRIQFNLGKMAPTLLRPKAFTDQVYQDSGEWNILAEKSRSANIYPISDEYQKDQIFKAPHVLPNLEGAVKIFSWGLKNLERGHLYWAFRSYFGNSTKPHYVFCDQSAGMMRTLLREKGFLTRNITIIGKDGWSHVVLEVWNAEKKKWHYFDPFYRAYSPSQNTYQVLKGKNDFVMLNTLGQIRPASEDMKIKHGKTLRKGLLHLIVSNGHHNLEHSLAMVP